MKKIQFGLVSILKTFFVFSFLSVCSLVANAEDVIWEVVPDPPQRMVVNRANESGIPGPTPTNNYALNQVFVDPVAKIGQEGTITTITTFYSAPANMTFFGVMGRLNFYQLDPGDADGLPNVDQNPDDGLVVPITITEVPSGSGMYEVVASGLNAIPDPKSKGVLPPFRIQAGIRYFVGLTPIIETSEVFEDHLANEVDDELRATAIRATDPPADPVDPWTFAAASNDLLETRIRIEGIASPDIYLSFADFGDGMASSDTTVVVDPGDTIEAFIWVDEMFSIDERVALDISLTSTDVVDFFDAETFQADIVGAVPGVRWAETPDQGYGFTGTVTDDFVDALFATSIVDGTGILPSQATGNLSVDTLHDDTSQAFLLGRVEMTVVGTAGESTYVTLSQDDSGIIDDNLLVFPTFGSVYIEVNEDCLLGDVNMDGVVDLLDVSPFVDAIFMGGFSCEADVNQDGVVDLLDVAPFINKLTGGGC